MVKSKDEGIYHLDKKITENISVIKKTVYTILGNQTALLDDYPTLSNCDDNSDLAYAKQEVINNKEYYSIKLDDEGLLLNPISANSMNKDHKFKVLKGKDKSWQYIKVNKECFNYYLDFLKTKNTLYLKYAERVR